jgi:hypothetical protein
MSAERSLCAAGWVVALSLLAACGPHPEPTSPQPPATADPEPADEPSTPWAKCHSTFTLGGDAAADVGLLGRMCGVKNQQKPLTGARVAVQNEHNAVDRFAFSAGGPGKCYRVFAVGERGIRDLDVQVVGPDGARLAWDASHEPWAAVPALGPLCLEQPGVYTVEVSVFRGSGRYAVQIWSN